ncbi:MAG: response regulator [Steroidobacteraceae bacterium]
MAVLRILIADDHELIRRGLAAALGDRPEWTIVAEAADGRQAVALATRTMPDIAVLDLTMPGLNGLEATRQIRAALPRVRVLIVTAHESEQLVREVLEAGALGYVLKSDAGRTLVQAIESLRDERPFFTSAIARHVVDGYLSAAQGAARAPPLTPRERHIIQLLAEGRSNKDVAHLLHISPKTVETHRANVMRKMGFESLADLVRYAVRNRIIEA